MEQPRKQTQGAVNQCGGWVLGHLCCRPALCNRSCASDHLGDLCQLMQGTCVHVTRIVHHKHWARHYVCMPSSLYETTGIYHRHPDSQIAEETDQVHK